MLLTSLTALPVYHHFNNGLSSLVIMSNSVTEAVGIAEVSGTVESARKVLEKLGVMQTVPTTVAYNAVAFKPDIVKFINALKDEPLEKWINSWLLNKFSYQIVIAPNDLVNPIRINFLDDGVNRRVGFSMTGLKEIDLKHFHKTNSFMIHELLFQFVKGDDYRSFKGLSEAIRYAKGKDLPFAVYQGPDGAVTTDKFMKLIDRLIRRAEKGFNLTEVRTMHYRGLLQARCRLGFPAPIPVYLLDNLMKLHDNPGKVDVGVKHAIIYPM